eukprot:10957302-Heterocapsa_arctica.AAC.1
MRFIRRAAKPRTSTDASRDVDLAERKIVAGLAVDLSFSWAPTAGLLARDGVPLEMRAKARVACVRRIL